MTFILLLLLLQLSSLDDNHYLTKKAWAPSSTTFTRINKADSVRTFPSTT